MTLLSQHDTLLVLSVMAYGIALLGLNLLFGQGGLLSFGHALFLALGAYAAASSPGCSAHQQRPERLSVASGEVTCLLGRNGAGKTTLLRTVMGYLRPSAGRVLLAGLEVTGWAPHRLARAGVGFSPEDSGVFAGLTVEENVRVATWAKPGGRPAEERVALARSVFPALARNWRRRGAEMSGGERKMLSIARALATDPDLLILDEPFEGLSPAIIPEVAEGIAAITATGRSVLLAESNAYHVPRFASSVYVLERGEVVFFGPPEAMAEDPAVRRIVEGTA